MNLPVEKGLLITRVFPGSSADRAGLLGFRRDQEGMLLGDIILNIDGSEINDEDDLYRTLNKRKIGDTVNVVLYREGERLTKRMKLSSASLRTEVSESGVSKISSLTIIEPRGISAGLFCVEQRGCLKRVRHAFYPFGVLVLTEAQIFLGLRKRCGKHCIHMIYHIVFFLDGTFNILANQ